MVDMHKTVEKSAFSVIENTKDIKELQEIKLDKVVFQKEFEKLDADVKVIRMATGDLFNTG